MNAKLTLAQVASRLRALSGGRLAMGSGANFLALINTTIVQLVSVPVYIAAFGLQGYGVWLILSTIPAYLVLSDFGLLTAAQSDMAMKHAAERYDEVLTVFQSISLMTVALFALFTGLATLGIWVTLESPWWPVELRPHLWTIPALCLYILLYIASFTSVAAMRATGQYARATIVHDSSALLESVSMMVAAWTTGSLVAAALAPALVRALTLYPIYREMRRLRPYLCWGLTHARLAEVKRLLRPALGSLAIPIALAANLQGSVLVTGAILGPVAVATLVPVRTASRLPVALLSAFNRALLPELSGAHGRNDLDRQQRYWRMSALLSLAVLLPAVVFLALFGVPLVSVWTGGVVKPDAGFVALMAIGAALHAVWFFRFLLLSASNAHARAAMQVVLVTTIGVGATTLGALWFGLTGVAGSLLLVELLMAVLLEAHLARRRVFPYSRQG